jgi:branched-chain amino acid transport system ATP-binding protein
MTIATQKLQVTDLVAGYLPGHPVLRGVNLTAEPGRITVVLGPNGAGKSTLLKAITGFLKPESGAVLLGQSEISSVDPHRHVEQGIGLLPQGRSVFPELSVIENIELGGWTIRTDRTRLRNAVEAMLDRYPHLRPLRDRPAGSLSGGQQRAVEIARMLVPNPSVLLIDEPSVGLSPIVASQVYQEMIAFKAEGRTVLLVDQDVRAAIRTADYVYVLNSGRNDVEGDRAAFEGDLGAMVRGWLGVSESKGGPR